MHESPGVAPLNELAPVASVARISPVRALIAIVLATAGGIALHIAVSPWLGERPTFVPTLLAVLLAAWAAGGFAGIATAVISAALFHWLPIAPPHTSFFAPPVDPVRIALSSALVVAMALVCEALHLAKRREQHRLDEARRIQVELRALNHQFQFALEAGRMVAWDWNLETGAVQRSDTAVSMFGLTDEPIESFYALVHPDDLPALRHATQAAIESGTGYEHQFRVRYIDGQYRSMMGRARIRRHPQTGATHLSGSAVDISERVQAEASTREVRDRFDAFMRHSPAAAYIKDEQGRYVYANRFMATLLQREPGDLVGRSDEEVLPPRIAEAYRANDAQVLNSGRTSEFHEVMPAAPGEEGDRDFLTFKFMLRDAQDRPLIGGMSLDITQRVRAERELRGSEARFHKMADSIPQLAWTARPDGTIEWFNRRWLDYTGVTLAQFTANGWQLVVEPSLLASMTQALRSGLDSASEIEMSFGLRAADGAHRPFLMKVLPLTDEAGNVLQWFGTHTDISTQVALEAQRREEDYRKDAFLATLAHELRNPLAPLRNGLEVLRRTGAVESPIARTHAMMDRQLNHVARLLDDLLDIARVRHGKLELHRQRVPLAQALDLAAETTESFLVNAGQTLRLEAIDRSIEVDADLFRLAQVFSNLLNNAAKFSHRGSSIVVSMRRDGFQAEVAIRDEGVGFTPEQLPFLFDMFWQATGDAPNARRGLGIGLSLVRNIIELHGGTVTAESRGPDHGSTFRVRLPLAVPRRAGVPVREAVAEAMPGVRVLIADDNEDAVESLAQLLRLDGHEVIVAHDGEEALRLAERERPQAAILDIGMPHLDGYDVCRQLRTQPYGAGMLIVALTGWGQKDDRTRSHEAGFNAHFVKPPQHDELSGILRLVTPAATAPVVVPTPIQDVTIDLAAGAAPSPLADNPSFDFPTSPTSGDR